MKEQGGGIHERLSWLPKLNWLKKETFTIDGAKGDLRT